MAAVFDLAGAGLVEIDDGALPILHAARELDLVAGFVRHRCPLHCLFFGPTTMSLARGGRGKADEQQGKAKEVHYRASQTGGIGSRLVLAGQRQHEVDEAVGRRCGQGAAARRTLAPGLVREGKSWRGAAAVGGMVRRRWADPVHRYNPARGGIAPASIDPSGLTNARPRPMPPGSGMIADCGRTNSRRRPRRSAPLTAAGAAP
jgi:hypothetical protein